MNTTEHQSFRFENWIYRWPMDFPHNGSVVWKVDPWQNVFIMHSEFCGRLESKNATMAKTFLIYTDCVIIIDIDALAPNRAQTINNHHTDLIVTIKSCEIYDAILCRLIIITPLCNPLVPLLFVSLFVQPNTFFSTTDVQTVEHVLKCYKSVVKKMFKWRSF